MKASMTELTDIFGYAYNTLNAATKAEPALPVADRPGQGRSATFDTVTVHKFFVDRAVRKALEKVEAETANGDEFDALKLRKLAAEAQLKELELAKARDEVAPVWQFERAMELAFAELRASMRNVPSRAARLLIGETSETRFKARLSEEIDLALHALADRPLTDEDQLDELPEDAGGEE